jgi:hypothetical protein
MNAAVWCAERETVKRWVGGVDSAAAVLFLKILPSLLGVFLRVMPFEGRDRIDWDRLSADFCLRSV